jgi:hypothetical protein
MNILERSEGKRYKSGDAAQSRALRPAGQGREVGGQNRMARVPVDVMCERRPPNRIVMERADSPAMIAASISALWGSRQVLQVGGMLRNYRTGLGILTLPFLHI